MCYFQLVAQDVVLLVKGCQEKEECVDVLVGNYTETDCNFNILKHTYVFVGFFVLYTFL